MKDSTWIIPFLEENWVVWCPHRDISSSRAGSALCDTWGPSDHRSSLVLCVHVMWWFIHVTDLTSLKHNGCQNSVLPLFPPLFSLFICCTVRNPEGFVPEEQREYIYSPVTHRLRVGVREGAHSSFTSAWMFSAAFGINPWLPPPQQNRRSCKSERKKFNSFFTSSHPLFFGGCVRKQSSKSRFYNKWV